MLARHARAAYVETWFSDEGGSLTVEGREQARLVGASLAGEGVVAVVTSDTSRAVQTGEIAAAQLARPHHPHLPVTAVKALREVHLGDLLGTAFHVERITDVTRQWHAGDLEVRFPGGESGTEVVRRHRDTLDEVGRAHPGATVLVVGHQTALGVALPELAATTEEAGGISAAYARDHPLENTERAVLRGVPGRWRLTGWGPTGDGPVSAPRRP
ncbi:MAG: hypothetical protein JWR42_1337 [Marmoricola sp.]|nr:hypothetical protein [Marmoricola sp.]